MIAAEEIKFITLAQTTDGARRELRLVLPKSAAALAFSRPCPDLLPPDSAGRPGKSAPLMDSFSKFSMVGVYETRKGLKFVYISSDMLEGRFTVLLFMDNR